MSQRVYLLDLREVVVRPGVVAFMRLDGDAPVVDGVEFDVLAGRAPQLLEGERRPRGEATGPAEQVDNDERVVSHGWLTFEESVPRKSLAIQQS